jgi:hypothetical protein
MFCYKDFYIFAVKNNNKMTTNKLENIRISVPELNIEKFKNVLLYLCEKCAGKPNVGETVINKLLYFCDFNYYELYEEHLTGATYIKRQFGPVPVKINEIINQMVLEKTLKIIETNYHGYPQKRYIPLEIPDLTLFSAIEINVIDNVIALLACLTANSISDYSHKDMPFIASKDNEEIHYNLVFYREPPYSIRAYNE